MNTSEARDLGLSIQKAITAGDLQGAERLLEPILAMRTPFRLLDRIGEQVGNTPIESVSDFLNGIAEDRSEGGWVVIASALYAQWERDPSGAFARARHFIRFADIWYAADITAERLPGPALLDDFGYALELLRPWRSDSDRWVRRSVGVATHFWAKRSRGRLGSQEQAQTLLEFLTPAFGEWDMDATKGIAWGLKTMGRYYPDLVRRWLVEQALPDTPRYRAHMLRKASLYLPDGWREI